MVCISKCMLSRKIAKYIFMTVAAVSLFSFMLIPRPVTAGSWNGWIYQKSYPTSLDLHDVKFITPLKGWMTGNYGAIFYTEDGGDTWEEQASGTEEELARITFINEKSGWATGWQGSIIHTGNGGKTWVKQYDAHTALSKVFFLNEKEGWVTESTPSGVVYCTKDGGNTWEKQETGINRTLSSVYFINSQTGWILAGEDVLRTTNGGAKWEKNKLPIGKLPVRRGLRQPPGMFMDPGDLPADTMNPVEEQSLGREWNSGDITFVNEKQGWAVVLQWIFHTADGGKTWTMQLDTADLHHELNKISFRDAQNGCVAGWTLYCTADGGRTWHERLGAGPHDDNMLGSVSLIGPSDGWAVGQMGRIFKTTDNGRSWKDTHDWSGCNGELFFINKKTGWRVAPQRFNKLCKTDDGGHTWRNQEIGIEAQNVFFVDDSSGWAVGKIVQSKDGEKTTYTRQSITVWGVIKHTSDGGKTWTTQHKESLGNNRFGFFGIAFINRKTGWVVGGNGTILHTTDGGKHWVHQKSGNITYSLGAVHFINSKVGWASGVQVEDHWTGIILSTEDGGSHWKVQHRMSDVWFRDLHFIDRASGWVSGETEYGDIGVLLHTKDGGKTWSEKEFEHIGSNHLGFLDKEHGVIYSVNTGLILITIDGGKAWNRISTPLKKYPWHISELFGKAANDAKKDRSPSHPLY